MSGLGYSLLYIWGFRVEGPELSVWDEGFGIMIEVHG